MKDSNKIVLQKIVKYCDDILFLLKKYDNDIETFKSDISFQYSCNMCIIQIGELVTRLDDEFIDEHKLIPWRAIRAMRNLHAHDYERVDMEIVWVTLTEDIPLLKEQISAIIEK